MSSDTDIPQTEAKCYVCGEVSVYETTFYDGNKVEITHRDLCPECAKRAHTVGLPNAKKVYSTDTRDTRHNMITVFPGAVQW